jgi:hypothetical protein
MQALRPGGVLAVVTIVLIGRIHAQGGESIPPDVRAEGAAASAIGAADAGSGAAATVAAGAGSEAGATSGVEVPEVIGATVESCFNSAGMIDISVLDDSHLYARSRGNNHYLITTEHCDGMERSYLHRTARLVPFGREVCENDGSHVVYETAGRERVCPVRFVQQVADRQQARDILAGNDPIVILEELPPE